MAKTIDDLLRESENVRDEQRFEQNTAERVGGLFVDVVDWLDENVKVVNTDVPHVLSDLNDVNTNGVSEGDILKYNGSKWVPYSGDTEGRGVSSIIYYYRAVASDYLKPGTHGQADINLNDYLSVEQTGWGTNKPYLYKRSLITYTDNTSEWGVTQLDNIWQNIDVEDYHGYSLIINPSYAIFEEPVDQENPYVDPDGSIHYGPGQIDTSAWNAKIQILKSDEPQIIGYDVENHINCTVTIAGEGTTELTITVDSLNSSSSVTTGLISFYVTIFDVNDGYYHPFFNVNIPIYINRIGSRYQVICGDVEQTIMTKVVYDDGGGQIIRFNNLGEYIRSSELNMSKLTTEVGNLSGDVTALTSEFEQTSSEIRMAVSANTDSIASIDLQVSAITSTVSANTQSISQINQTVDEISLGVTSLESGIIRTGIDIEQGKITLAANKVTFTNSDGTVNNKISIDPVTGTLHAVDGEFEGDITARSLKTSTLPVSGSTDSLNPTVIPLLTNPAGVYHLKGGGYFSLPKAWDFLGKQITLFISPGEHWEHAHLYTTDRYNSANSGFHILGYRKSDMSELEMLFDNIECSTSTLSLLSTSVYNDNNAFWEIMSQRGSISCGGRVVYPDGCFTGL